VVTFLFSTYLWISGDERGERSESSWIHLTNVDSLVLEGSHWAGDGGLSFQQLARSKRSEAFIHLVL